MDILKPSDKEGVSDFIERLYAKIDRHASNSKADFFYLTPRILFLGNLSLEDRRELEERLQEKYFDVRVFQYHNTQAVSFCKTPLVDFIVGRLNSRLKKMPNGKDCYSIAIPYCDSYDDMDYNLGKEHFSMIEKQFEDAGWVNVTCRIEKTFLFGKSLVLQIER